MPSLWDKLRGSRRKMKVRSKSVNDSTDEDEFLDSIRKRESFIETTKTDWVEVPMPKTQSLGRGMKLETDRKAKSATLDVGFSFKRGKNEWKPKVKDIEEVKVKTKTKKESELKKYDLKKETKFDKKKDKRKSREVDFENAQLERGESILVGRKMVLWRAGRKRDSQFDMEPVSTVDEWAACSKTTTSPGSLTPGSPGSISVQTPGSLQPSVGSLTTPSPQNELAPLVESTMELDSSGVISQCFHQNQGPSATSVAHRPASFHQPGPESLVPSARPILKVQIHDDQSAADTVDAGSSEAMSPSVRSPDVGPVLRPPGAGFKSPRKMSPKKRSQSKDSLQSPTFESRTVTLNKIPSSPQPESGPVLKPPPSKIPKPTRRSQNNKQNGAATSPTSPTLVEGPVLTPPAKSMAQISQDKGKDTGLRTSNQGENVVTTEVETCDQIKDCIVAGTNPDSVLGTTNPDDFGNREVDLHKSLHHCEQSSSDPGDRSAKLALSALLERTAPPAKSTDDLTDIDEAQEPLLNGSTYSSDSINVVTTAKMDIYPVDKSMESSVSAEIDEDTAQVDSAAVDVSTVSGRNSVEIGTFMTADSVKLGSLVTSDSMVIIHAEDAPAIDELTGNDGLPSSLPETAANENACSQQHETEKKNKTAALDIEGNESKVVESIDDMFGQFLQVEPSMNGNCDISPSGAGDTLANTTADEFYINSTKYFNENLEENGIFEMELQETKDSGVVDLQQDFENLKKPTHEPVEIQIQIPEKILPPKHLRNFELQSPGSPCRPSMKPICLVAYPRRLVNLSPCERCSRSIDSILSGLDDLDSPILEQDVHDWVLVDKDFESPKLSKRKLDKKVQTDFQNPIDIKKPRVCSSNSSSLPEMRASIERNSCTLEDLDSMAYDDYVVPSQLLRPTEAHYRISGQCSDEFELFGQISPLGQSCNSPLEEEPAKKPPSKPPVSQIKGHQPDLVSNSIGSRAHAAQEISRLEALCEARTKELTFAKMQIKTASQGFDAMSVIVQYLSHEMNAFQSPELNKRLINAEKKIVGLLADLDELRGEKSRIESTMHDLIQSHKDATEAMRNDHRAQMGHVEERVCKRYDEDLQKVVDQHTEEVKTLKSYHEKRFNELEDRSERHSEDTRKKHTRQLNDLAESDERHLSELQKQHEIKLEEITKRFEEIKCVLHDKVYTLKAECDELRNRSQMYEEALQRDTDFQLQLALAPYRDLPQEIDSLRTVVEMRNAEIHELRQSKVELERQLEELPHARERIISLEQKIENLEAIVTMKQDYEKQLVEKHQHLLRRFDKEFKANKRLSMDNEELMYRLNETEDLLLSPSPERTGASPVTTPDILARRGFCRSPHDTASVTRRQRTSSTSSSDDKRSSTISMRSEDEKGS